MGAVSVDTAQEQGRPPLASEDTPGELRRYPVQYRGDYRTHATSQSLETTGWKFSAPWRGPSRSRRLVEVVLIAQFLTLCNPVDCNLSGSSVHGIFPSKNTGVGCRSLLQRIFLNQRLNPGLLHFKQIQGGWRSFIQGQNGVSRVFPHADPRMGICFH